MIEAYKKMFINYANFKDRTSRRDYWLAVLMNLIVSFAIGFVLGFISGLLNVNWITYLSYIYALAVLIPGLAMSVRRLHDINKSGWLYLISLIPLAGSIILLVFECKPSVTENNDFGVQL